VGDNQTFYISTVSVRNKDVMKERELIFFFSPLYVLTPSCALLVQGSLFTFTFEVKCTSDDHWKKKFTEDERRK